MIDHKVDRHERAACKGPDQELMGHACYILADLTIPEGQASELLKDPRMKGQEEKQLDGVEALGIGLGWLDSEMDGLGCNLLQSVSKYS